MSKPKMLTVYQPDAGLIASENVSLGTPHIAYSTSDTFTGKLVSVTVDADDYRAWQAGLSNTSGEKHGE